MLGRLESLARRGRRVVDSCHNIYKYTPRSLLFKNKFLFLFINTIKNGAQVCWWWKDESKIHKRAHASLLWLGAFSLFLKYFILNPNKLLDSCALGSSVHLKMKKMFRVLFQHLSTSSSILYISAVRNVIIIIITKWVDDAKMKRDKNAENFNKTFLSFLRVTFQFERLKQFLEFINKNRQV